MIFSHGFLHTVSPVLADEQKLCADTGYCLEDFIAESDLIIYIYIRITLLLWYLCLFRLSFLLFSLLAAVFLSSHSLFLVFFLSLLSFSFSFPFTLSSSFWVETILGEQMQHINSIQYSYIVTWNSFKINTDLLIKRPTLSRFIDFPQDFGFSKHPSLI